jgi:hypothetical protein
MKRLTLIGQEWKQQVAVQLTDEEKSLLADRSDAAREQRIALLTRIREESIQDASPEDAASAQAIYNQYKIEGATLIAADISLPSGSGIINCRLNGEHKQIRF